MYSYKYCLNRSTCSEGFKDARNSSFFVDKSALIELVNSKIATKEKWICVSRPRRFGKTMALEMLAAYYTKGVQAEELFKDLRIARFHSFYRHLNCHNVVQLNFSEFFENTPPANGGIMDLSCRIISDLKQDYPDLPDDVKDLSLAFDMVQQAHGAKFIFLIDEWDAIFRLRKGKKAEHEEFLNFLKLLFKDKTYVELVYMTGILPIKKYNTGSALNMFREYTMLGPKRLSPYFGFTKDEIEEAVSKSDVSMEELREWYDGYYIEGEGHIFNPKSVSDALNEGICKDYWGKSGGFSELEEYITMNFDGLGKTVTQLLAGEQIEVNVLGFSNDLDSFQDKDEVITALIHLGYLTYQDGKVRIPNRELREEFANTVKKLSWGPVSQLLNQSQNLLRATLRMDEEAVSQALESVHDDMQEFKEYNNEHTLKCVIHLAYYAALDFYHLTFEPSAGKGIADCIMTPRRAGLPGIILELKYNSSAEAALQQIHDRDYVKALPASVRKVILAGINYDKKSKRHVCRMEKIDRIVGAS